MRQRGNNGGSRIAAAPGHSTNRNRRLLATVSIACPTPASSITTPTASTLAGVRTTTVPQATNPAKIYAALMARVSRNWAGDSSGSDVVPNDLEAGRVRAIGSCSFDSQGFNSHGLLCVSFDANQFSHWGGNACYYPLVTTNTAHTTPPTLIYACGAAAVDQATRRRVA